MALKFEPGILSGVRVVSYEIKLSLMLGKTYIGSISWEHFEIRKSEEIVHFSNVHVFSAY